MSEMAVEIEYLRKLYGRFEALKGISLRVPRAAVFGLLGPNGAGKSTMVKSLLTIIRPTECRGTLLGSPIGNRKTLGRVGYLPEQARFPEYMTGREVITYSGRLAQVSKADIQSRIRTLLPLVKMEAWADRPVATYSKGMRQRIGLAQALVNDPDLVFLDEPTDGVDPEGRMEIREIIDQMKADGKTVFVNSHLLSEIEQVADSAAILSGGEIVRTGTISELTRQNPRYLLKTLGPVPALVRERLEQGGLKVAGDTITIDTGDIAEVQPVIDALRSASVSIREMREDRNSLEEIYIQTVRGKGRETA